MVLLSSTSHALPLTDSQCAGHGFQPSCLVITLCGVLSPSQPDTPPRQGPVLGVSHCPIEGERVWLLPSPEGDKKKEQDLVLGPCYLPNPRARRFPGGQGYASSH